jgi:Family of unknown function (DUF5995)
LRDIVTPPVSAVKGSEPPPHIADVLDRFRAVEAAAPPPDGVACFARLYREVTEGVAAELTTEGVADPGSSRRSTSSSRISSSRRSSRSVTIPPAHRRRGFRCSPSARGEASRHSSSRWPG